jgi:hypothetical protein
LGMSEHHFGWLHLVSWNCYRYLSRLSINSVIKSWSLLDSVSKGSNKSTHGWIDVIKSREKRVFSVWNN